MKALGTFVGWKMLKMTNEDALINLFGGLFEVKMPFHTKAYIERGVKKKHFSYPDYFTLSSVTAWALWTKVSG